MHCIILKNNLKDGLAIVSNAKKENSQLPILKNVLLEANDNKVRISTTDLEIGIVNSVSAKILSEGSVVVPFAIFQQIIQNATSERVELETKGSSLNISTDNYNAKIGIAQKEEFPIIPDLNSGSSKELEIDSVAFINALQITSPACHLSEFRPELSGILFDIKDGSMYTVATDSFRLAKTIIPKKKIIIDQSISTSIIVPLRTVQEIIRIFQSDSNNIKVLFDDNQIVIKNDSTRLVSRLIDGKFPDYSIVIPKSFESELVVSKNELIQALRLTSSLSNRLNEVKIKIDDSMKNIQLFSASHEFGESEYILSVKTKGIPLSISYNWRFLLDGLRNIVTDSVFIGINSEQKPSIIQAPNDDSYIYVLTSIKAA